LPGDGSGRRLPFDDFWNGYSLAAFWRPLERRVAALGLEPLASSGLPDDRVLTPWVRWRLPGPALETVVALLEDLKGGGELVDALPGEVVPLLADELRRLADALALAGEKGIEFSFLVRTGRDEMLNGRVFDGGQGRFL
jgi:hypothetical protein